MTSPLFVVFEGVDGSGKSSQLRRLAERVEAAGRRVVRLFEPTDGPHGSEIRRRARQGPPLEPREELDLFVEDRKENVAGSILPALARGDVVLQDRYLYSSAAYQAARPELGLTPGDVVRMHDGWAPRPDLVVLLDLPVGTGLARVRRRGAGDAFEEEVFQERVRQNYLRLAEEEPTIFRRIDAAGDEEQVAAAVWDLVAPLLEAERSTP
jgi:dTMP kinase